MITPIEIGWGGGELAPHIKIAALRTVREKALTGRIPALREGTAETFGRFGEHRCGTFKIDFSGAL
jgi:hypothetical protein